MSREDHARSSVDRVSNAMMAKGKTRNYYSAHNLTSRVSFSTQASVNDSDQDRGQNLHGNCTGNEVEERTQAMVATARQKCSYLHHQGEFQHKYYVFVSVSIRN